MLDLTQHPADRAALVQVEQGLNRLWFDARQVSAVAEAITAATERITFSDHPAEVDTIISLAGAVTSLASLAEQRIGALQQQLAACVKP